MTAENVLVNGAIGAGAGLLTGVIINEYQKRQSPEEIRIIREAQLIGSNQTTIDKLRKEVDESSDWGKNESRSWEERYQTEDSHRPYLGVKHYRRP